MNLWQQLEGSIFKSECMITVEEADRIIATQVKDFGTETVPFESSVGRVLVHDLVADRDLPPFNRATLDGIAIKYASFEKGIRSFKIRSIQAAGDIPQDINREDECIEIMTGAALPPTTDTVIGYEDIAINNGMASITRQEVNRGGGVHLKGKDKREKDIVVPAGVLITPVIINIAASIGAIQIPVKKIPRTIIISSGDEMVAVEAAPSPFQLRRSNSYMIRAALMQYHVYADVLHIPDDLEITRNHICDCLEKYDVMIFTGGISMGKFDYIPQALQESSVETLFHKVQQRPGKPFWFGRHATGVTVFALPGNPVSTFMCLYRYVLPWLRDCTGDHCRGRGYAILAEDVHFNAPLQYFLQVKLSLNNNGELAAMPVEGNGSGDFANFAASDAFMELPREQNNFTKGGVFTVWPFRQVFL
jgi:molybdopterin molybdotransferase